MAYFSLNNYSLLYSIISLVRGLEHGAKPVIGELSRLLYYMAWHVLLWQEGVLHSYICYDWGQGNAASASEYISGLHE